MRYAKNNECVLRNEKNVSAEIKWGCFIRSILSHDHGVSNVFAHRASLKMIGYTILCWYMPKLQSDKMGKDQILRSRILVDFQCILDSFWVKCKIFCIQSGIRLFTFARMSQILIDNPNNMCLFHCKICRAFRSLHVTFCMNLWLKTVIFWIFLQLH